MGLRGPALLTLFLVISCGKDDTSACLSRETKRLQCRAEAAAPRPFSTDRQLEIDEENCNRKYLIEACYSEAD